MSFDLNKSGKVKNKFELSKSTDSSSPVTKTGFEAETSSTNKKSKLLPIGIVAIILIVFGIWYFSTRNSSDGLNGNKIEQKNTSEKKDPSGNENKISGSTQDKESSTNKNASDSNLSSNGSKQNETSKTKSENSSSNNPENSSSNNSDNSNPNNNSNSNTNSQKNKVVKSSDLEQNSKNNSSTNNTSNNFDTKNKIPAYFKTSSSSPVSIDHSLVKDILNKMNKNSSSKLVINGFSSSDGDLKINQSLAQKRANAFKNYLIRKGINSNRITTIGNGIENPIASNDTPAGRSKNRRVELSLTE